LKSLRQEGLLRWRMTSLSSRNCVQRKNAKWWTTRLRIDHQTRVVPHNHRRYSTRFNLRLRILMPPPMPTCSITSLSSTSSLLRCRLNNDMQSLSSTPSLVCEFHRLLWLHPIGTPFRTQTSSGGGKMACAIDKAIFSDKAFSKWRRYQSS